MTDENLDDYEQSIVDEINKGEISFRELDQKELASHKQAAANTIERKQALTIRLSHRDMYRLKKASLEKGMPLGTLVSSYLHQNIDNATASVSNDPPRLSPDSEV